MTARSRGVDMGSLRGAICRICGTRFTVRSGGGFYFDLLHCDQCGMAKSFAHDEMGEVHLRFVKGLPGPYALARSAMDRRIQTEYTGAPLSRDEDHAAVEATPDPCRCGGRFRYDAPPRCPGCRSTQEVWDRDPTISSAYID